MSIEKSPEQVTVVIGDADVLIGQTAVPGVVRVWFAPLPPGYPDAMDKVVERSANNPPPDTAATLYFVKSESLESFINMLSAGYRKAFPANMANGVNETQQGG